MRMVMFVFFMTIFDALVIKSDLARFHSCRQEANRGNSNSSLIPPSPRSGEEKGESMQSSPFTSENNSPVEGDDAVRR